MNILLTGAGGAAAISFLKAVKDHNFKIFMADMDPYAAGLYLVPENQRLILPRGTAQSFVPTLMQFCQYHNIDVLIPTVESELLPIDDYRSLFEFGGTKVLMTSRSVLQNCLDKWTLSQVATTIVPTPRTALLDSSFKASEWQFPLVAKTRRGSGSNGVHIVKDLVTLNSLPHDASMIVQAYLPGAEYSVDVLATPDGKVVSAVPRERLKVDSGIAVAARTKKDARLEKLARILAERIGITFVANIQFKVDADGMPRLLEINPRFPGTMPLTVASGVNMPLLSLKFLEGYEGKPEEYEFKETAVIRYLEEKILDISALTQQEIAQSHLQTKATSLKKAA